MKGESFFMSRHKVELTGVDTANIEVLNSEEMTKLLKEYKAGNTTVKDRLVTGNLKLVLSILKRFTKKEENMDDLFQVGCIGLLKAIENFDTSYDVKFSTYAVPMIEGEVKRYLRDNSSIRVSRSLKDLAYRALRFKESYFANTGQSPSTEEIATALEVTPYDVIHALDSLKEPISMFEPIYNDGGDTIYLYDQIEDKKGREDVATNMALQEALKKLTPREHMIIENRFVLGKTQMEIAESLGISQAQVSRLEKGAIAMVKKLVK